MSLRKQLSELLATILSPDPKQAIKGTELIRLVRMQLEGNYSDASLRYHFSIMSCDPTSPIAKVEKGQGYYRRTANAPALSSAQEIVSITQGRLGEACGADPGQIDITLARLRKFRAIVTRFFEVSGRFPFIFREAFEDGAPVSNLWKYPDLALIDWQTEDAPDEEMPLDNDSLALKSLLGLPPCTIAAARLRLRPSLETFREDIYQAVSTSSWSQSGELIYALPVEDEALGDAMRSLASKHGVAITTFGLNYEKLDDLPRPANILNAHPVETEALLARLDVTRISARRVANHVDWTILSALRSESREMRALFTWIDRCVKNGRAEPYDDEKRVEKEDDVAAADELI